MSQTQRRRSLDMCFCSKPAPEYRDRIAISNSDFGSICNPRIAKLDRKNS